MDGLPAMKTVLVGEDVVPQGLMMHTRAKRLSNKCKSRRWLKGRCGGVMQKRANGQAVRDQVWADVMLTGKDRDGLGVS
jgi:hypothetical protein